MFFPPSDVRNFKKYLFALLDKDKEWKIDKKRSDSGGFTLKHDPSGLTLFADRIWKSVTIKPAAINLGDFAQITLYEKCQSIAARLMQKGMEDGNVDSVCE